MKSASKLIAVVVLMCAPLCGCFQKSKVASQVDSCEQKYIGGEISENEAICIAIGAVKSQWDAETAKKFEPYIVTKKNSSWIVEGTLYGSEFGGAPIVHINARGEITAKLMGV